jgi:hypothetical protein
MTMTYAAAASLFALQPTSATLVAEESVPAPTYRGLSPFGRSVSAAASVIVSVVLVGAVVAGFASIDDGAPSLVTAAAPAASRAG